MRTGGNASPCSPWPRAFAVAAGAPLSGGGQAGRADEKQMEKVSVTQFQSQPPVQSQAAALGALPFPQQPWALPRLSKRPDPPTAPSMSLP